MDHATRQPQSLLPLSAPVFHILLALADGDRHGYAIMKEVEQRSGGRVKLSTGTLYTAIKRLLDDALIRESDKRPRASDDDQRRRYYRLTRFGRAVARAETQRLMEMVSIARAKRLVSSPVKR